MRALVAGGAGGLALLLASAGVLPGSAVLIVLATLAYVALVGGVTMQVQRRGIAQPPIVALSIIADLAFIFALTIASSPPERFDRVLIFSFIVLHLTQSHFGRRYAVLALTAIVAGYVGLVAATARLGEGTNWPQDLWSLALFATAAVSFVVQYGGFQRRLQRIVTLFERAGQGDLDGAYETPADAPPDAITRVGRAYNRVREQLATMVHTDPLTECLNRRGLDQALAREIARSARAGSEHALVAIDIDHFKDVNDSLGHVAGDSVLREFGALLAQTARAGDTVARTGGEEFAVLLPDTDPAGAFKAATRLCEIVRAHDFLVNGQHLNLTISAGVVSSDTTADDATGATLKERADDALYAAKRSGRDRVRVWNGTLSAAG